MEEKESIYLFINSLRGGGAEKVCVNLSNFLNRSGYKVTLCVWSLEAAAYDKNLNSGVELVNLKTEHTRKSFVKLFKFIKTRDPNIIISFNHQISILLVILRTINKFNYKIISRNINMLSNEKKEKNLWHKYVIYSLLKILYRKVDLVISQSNLMKKDLIDEFNFNSTKIKVINNPVDKIIEEEVKINGAVKIKNNKKNVLFVGRLTRQKGLDYLIASFKKCISIDPEISLTIIGDGPLKGWVCSEIQKLELNNKIEIKNFTNDIVNEYKKASLVVLSSRFEGFPNVLVEAISLGIPIVSFDCPSGPRDIIVEKKNGLLVDEFNTNKMAEKIVSALYIDWDSSEIINSSKKYSTSKIYKEYEKTIKEMLPE